MSDRRDREILNTLRRIGSVEPDADRAQQAIALTRSRLATEAEHGAQNAATSWHRPFAARFPARRFKALVPALGLIAVLLSVWLLGSLGRPAVALADVVRALHDLQTIRYTTSIDNGQGFVIESQTMMRDRNLVRIEHTDGRVFVFDRARGQSLSLYPDQQRAVVMYGGVARKDMFDVVDSLEHQSQITGMLPERDIQGVRAVGFVLTQPTTERVIWVDPRSRLLVRWESSTRDEAGKTTQRVYANFVYGQPLNPASFDLTPPPGYRVEKQGVPELAPLLADTALQSPVLIVQQGIGPAKFGMPRGEVFRVFGQPDEVAERLQSYRYLSRGIELFIAPDRGLWGVICRTQPVAPSRIRDYSGRTEAGIGMGATADEIVAAYGPPDERVVAGSGETLSYKSLSLHFSLYDGRLAFIQHDASRPKKSARPQ